MNVKKYEDPPNDKVCMGPQTSEWTRTKIDVALVAGPSGKAILRCLPQRQPSHRDDVLKVECTPVGSCLDCVVCKAQRFRCPMQWCQRKASFLREVWVRVVVASPIELHWFEGAPTPKGYRLPCELAAMNVERTVIRISPLDHTVTLKKLNASFVLLRGFKNWK